MPARRPRVGAEGPNFSYTIGLTASYHHPELMIFGLDSKVSHGILSDCAAKIRNGIHVPIHEPVADLVGGDYKVCFKPVLPAYYAEYLGTARRYYKERPFTALVMFWPDKEHRFPWQGGASSAQQEAWHIVAQS